MKHVKIVFVILLSLMLFSCSEESTENKADATSDTAQTSGVNSLITITDEEPGENCEAGGKRIDTGLDDNGDNILDEDEIDSTNYVCNGIDGEDGIDSTSNTNTVHNLTGKFEKGRCWEGGEIRVWPINDGSLTQMGKHFIGTTSENGAYNIRAETDQDYVLIYSELTCDDEVNGGSGLQELFGYRKTSDLSSNINILTKISKPVADSLFDDGFGTVPESIIEAERLTRVFLGLPELEKRFSEMSLRGETESDAALALVSSMILHNRTTAEQGEYTSKISTWIINGDSNTAILEAYQQLLLADIKTNLIESYAGASIEINAPPFWNLMNFPAYYGDIFSREPVEQGSFNLEDSATCSMDMPYKRYAIPHIIESWIETSKYLASNLSETVSIWSRGVHGGGYDAPGNKLLDITELREKLLDSTLSHHGMIDGHSLSAGDEVYFVIESETAFVLSVGCDGGLLPFGRKIASNDGGLTYIGHDNNTTFFRKSGLKLSGVN